MTTVWELIRGKRPEVFAVQPDVTLHHVVELMIQHNVGSLVVLEGDEPCGIITERDFLRKVVLEGRDSHTTHAAEVMTSWLIAVDPETSTERCMQLMTQHRIRHLVVVRNGVLVGIVSMGDIVKELAEERASMIEQLTEYVQGRA